MGVIMYWQFKEYFEMYNYVHILNQKPNLVNHNLTDSVCSPLTTIRPTLTLIVALETTF